MKQPVISRSPDIMSGSVVFHGTRVPVETLLDVMETGEMREVEQGHCWI